MAKAGFWLRGAKGKLAGAVAQKGQNGTILREIVTPKNPKTEKQIYQRAVMATVMKAYSAGKVIFDHSIQGLERGAKTQQYFIAKNAKILRSNIVYDLNHIATDPTQGPQSCEAACVAPKAIYGVPNAYLISEGTYENTLFTPEDGGVQWLPADVPSVQSETTGKYETTVADAAAALGLRPGDIYTIVAMVSGDTIVHNGVDQSGNESDLPGTKQHNLIFAYIRYQVKDDVLTSTTLVSEESADRVGYKLLSTPGLVFEVTGSLNSHLLFEDGDTINDVIPLSLPEDKWGSFGIIRSRLDEDLRSTAYMLVKNYSGSTEDHVNYGITSPYILPTWRKGADSLGTSELILESDQQGV